MKWKRARASFPGRESLIDEGATVGELIELLKAIPPESILEWRVRTEAVENYHVRVQGTALHAWTHHRREDGGAEPRLVVETMVQFPTYDRLHPAFYSAAEARVALRSSLGRARRWARKIEETLAELKEEDERQTD